MKLETQGNVEVVGRDTATGKTVFRAVGQNVLTARGKAQLARTLCLASAYPGSEIAIYNSSSTFNGSTQLQSANCNVNPATGGGVAFVATLPSGGHYPNIQRLALTEALRPSDVLALVDPTTIRVTSGPSTHLTRTKVSTIEWQITWRIKLASSALSNIGTLNAMLSSSTKYLGTTRAPNIVAYTDTGNRLDAWNPDSVLTITPPAANAAAATIVFQAAIASSPPSASAKYRFQLQAAAVPHPSASQASTYLVSPALSKATRYNGSTLREGSGVRYRATWTIT